MTNFDAVFCKKYLAIWFRENAFFWGLIIAFLGLKKLIFSTLWWFPKIEGRPSIFGNHLFGHIVGAPLIEEFSSLIRARITVFSRELSF